MFELKYFRLIDAYERSEREAVEPPPARAFDIDELGPDNTVKRAITEVVRIAVLVVFRLLRAFWPVARIGRLIIVSRHADVRAVLEDREHFQVPFGPEMRSLTGGADFALGLDGEAHDRQRRFLDAVVRRADAKNILERTRYFTTALLANSGGRIDVMTDLLGRVLTETCSEYFGLDLDEPHAFLDRSIGISALIFADPFGSLKTRRLAMNGAQRVCYLVDRAIARAHVVPRDSVIDRLVQFRDENGATIPDSEIRAMTIGTMTGLIPTNLLGAGKMLEELMRRGLLPKAIEAAAAAERHRDSDPEAADRHRQALRALLFEASRLNPALFPGQWRFAPRTATIAGKTVEAGSVVMVATLSALRDRRAFTAPDRFEAGRKIDPDLMFGTGSHRCLGAHLAMEQITEIFQILLAQPGIRVARGAAGIMSHIGPYPRRLDMVFEPIGGPAQQNMVTIQAPLEPDTLADVRAMIVALGNPATADSAIGQALARTNLVHFASLSAFDAADPDDAQAAPDPRLVLELSVDGEADRALQRIVDEAGPLIEPIFRRIAGSGTRSLAELLHAHNTRLHFFPWGATGLNFNGTPDCPVGDIEQQRQVSAFVRDALDRFLRSHGGVHKRAMDVLTYVRSLTLPYETVPSAEASPADPAAVQAEAALRDQGKALRPFLIRPAGRRLAMSDWTGRGNSVGWPSLLRSTVGLYGLLLLIAVVCLNGAAIHAVVGTTPWITPTLLVVSGVATAALLIATFVANGFTRIREGWDRIVTLLVYLGIPLAGLLALAIVIGGVAVASCEASWILQGWFPTLAENLRWVLAVACGLVVTTIVLRALAVLLPLLWRYRRPLTLAVAATAVLAVLWFLSKHLGALALTVTGGVLASFLLFLAVAGVFLAVLYWHEQRDVPDERTAPLDSIARIAATENPPGYVHNHITAVTPLKPGAFRKLTLAVSLWGIGKLVQYWFRPGFVLNMGTIHYARWFRLPGSEMLVFFSNYDGSWQSYLEDFVTKAHSGQSAAWSNGRGFPKTTLLVLEGAKDGDRFKRWVRRQQIVTQFWYSRFPDMTTDQIRTNALIHDGLMRAQTDTAARAWLDCIGTMPRPDDALETDEIQSIVFRGLPAYRYTLNAALVLPEDRAARGAWLDLLRKEVRFGEQPDLSQRRATFVGFSARGIARCLDCHDRPEEAERVMSTFPSAFRLGMASRAAILGDRGASAPDSWRWTDADTAEGSARTADVMLFVYGRTIEDCRETLDRHYAVLKPAATWEITTQPTEKSLKAEEEGKSKGAAPMYEHFGFRDGISQPIIRGSQRATATGSAADLVAAGELILGYRNSAGYVAPAVTVPAEHDPGDDLETDTPSFASRFPRFDGSQDSESRDFGRNGTFVAVRQLVQDVEGFNGFVAAQRRELESYPGIQEAIGGPITEDWIAAKMMGRWHTGASLIRAPHAVKGRQPPETADNDFNFASDDPQGLRCPFGAHIRRANPRGSLAPDDPAQGLIERRHRLLRRGRPYTGADGDPAERGMLFVALCADLERQFEFLQQSWIGSPAFHGLTNEPDPITGPPPCNGTHDFTIPTTAGAITLKGLRNFVTVKAGGYFFMPSRSALRFLASQAERPPR
ncbi:MAG: cytochrome P450 [Reyranella sp.]|uniref:cytochrome P450 n=1 Tax=Reyranella sp. TaxID=1929291 RepID=UPI003D0EFC31